MFSPLHHAHRLTATVLCLLLPAAASAAVAGDPYVGATVSGRASQYALVCGTCSTEFTAYGPFVDGGPGATSAALSHAEPGYSISGSAALTGPDALPVLGAAATADIIVDPSIPKTHFYKSSVTAEAMQKYVYTGSVGTTYEITYTITGDFVLNGTDAASLMQVFGGVTVFGEGYNPFQEVQPTLDFAYSSANASAAGTTPFSLTDVVSFSVDPGQGFYLRALLEAIADASHQIAGSVDASHTLELAITAGDPALLSPVLQAVPLPAAVWLFAPALAAALRRRPAAV